ncbi:YhjD/YihY/BrkB family envelope integrity protein [Streptomyces sp. HPF1205]|uniref:YhjD/YihY/BrkB family envelope integrity protein n=1 Tax=Streptomyces sp. HPF1205 TaxID=2873262 RepID=UPI001CEC3D88|nr:ribonuclease BN [Streptomyces sp. HPF1205]
MARLRAAAERRFPVITELTARLLSANLLEAGTRLAAQVFLTAVPLLFVVAAFAPHDVRSALLASARGVFGLNGAAERQLREVHGTGSEELRQTTGAIGVVIALLSATSTSRAMARICERAWRLPRPAARTAVWRWFAWLVTWLGALVLQGPLRDGFGAGPAVGVPLTLVSDILLWWWTQWLLLASRVAWRPLLPGAVLTAAAMTALSATARLYMPTALNRSLATYGSLGSVFTMQSWLIATCVVVAFTLTTGAVLAPVLPLRHRPPSFE